MMVQGPESRVLSLVQSGAVQLCRPSWVFHHKHIFSFFFYEILKGGAGGLILFWGGKIALSSLWEGDSGVIIILFLVSPKFRV